MPNPDLVARAKAMQAKRASQKDAISNSHISDLSDNDMYLKLGLHIVAFFKGIAGTDIYKLGHFFSSRGMCPRAKTALKNCKKNNNPLIEIRTQLLNMVSIIDHIVLETS
jgi:hypothetical protein